ncbi:uncharacterized protein CEXT_238641 [Caerostris extrusa]|uniref:Uncharacterized protein n=1 Tax=Caerostris extrusa TaxID=172846 RepID=A0AAV4PDI5_CAEEX|nr:uncharacterized protein CEXT_238641 [Caerostris extrusa]
MQELLPLTPRQQTQRAVFVSKDLSTCSHLFQRSDTIKKGLQPPYEGPLQVLSRSEKVFKLLIHGRQSVVNIDRLTPAYISKEEESTPSKTEQVLKESSQDSQKLSNSGQTLSLTLVGLLKRSHRET